MSDVRPRNRVYASGPHAPFCHCANWMFWLAEEWRRRTKGMSPSQKGLYIDATFDALEHNLEHVAALADRWRDIAIQSTLWDAGARNSFYGEIRRLRAEQASETK